MSFEEALKREKIRNLSTRQTVTATPGESLGEVTRKMQEKRTGCAVILEGKKIIGISVSYTHLTLPTILRV